MMTRSLSGKAVAVLVALVVCTVTVSGCASMRKKFTRKPKGAKQSDVFIPVLQPVEYARVVETPGQVYRDHYAMVKVYFKSLWDVLGTRDGGAKREKYILAEMLARFDAMAALLSDVKKAEAKSIHERVEEVLKAYDKPESMRRYDLMKSAMVRVERDIHKGFKPDIVKDSFASCEAEAAASK